MGFKGIELDWSVLVANVGKSKIILLATDEYDSTGMVNAYDLKGNTYKLEPDLGGFNSKTGKGWLTYWYDNRCLECVYEDLEVHKVMKKMGINRNDMVSIETLKKFEEAMNPKKHTAEESL